MHASSYAFRLQKIGGPILDYSTCISTLDSSFSHQTLWQGMQSSQAIHPGNIATLQITRGTAEYELRDDCHPSFTLQKDSKIICLGTSTLLWLKMRKMYSQEYEKLHNAADESQETLLESNIPIEKLHKCFSLRKALAIHACVLSFYTVLALLAWRLSMQSFCASTKYGNGTYSMSQSVDFSDFELLLNQIKPRPQRLLRINWSQ
jgi:hypothetical protein